MCTAMTAIRKPNSNSNRNTIVQCSMLSWVLHFGPWDNWQNDPSSMILLKRNKTWMDIVYHFFNNPCSIIVMCIFCTSIFIFLHLNNPTHPYSYPLDRLCILRMFNSILKAILHIQITQLSVVYKILAGSQYSYHLKIHQYEFLELSQISVRTMKDTK